MVCLGVSYWGLTEALGIPTRFGASSYSEEHTRLAGGAWNRLHPARRLALFSPDLSPLDYKIWQHLEEKACSEPHPNLESLKISLIQAAADIDMDLAIAAIDDWPRRLKACIQNHGGTRLEYLQDSAPAHRPESTQYWLAAREIDFIRHEDWSSSSPDLSPLDYKIWQHLEEKAYSKPHPNLESLKTSLIKAAADIYMDLVHAPIDDWPRRLKACIQNHGGHFE
ncbi:hypothetical protein evm_013679 [Chilo suppressalis]|nr:hypothetical protein evm_013679 [Chilo suppressalis]